MSTRRPLPGRRRVPKVVAVVAASTCGGRVTGSAASVPPGTRGRSGLHSDAILASRDGRHHVRPAVRPGIGHQVDREAEPSSRDTRRMVDDNARELAIYHALKAVDEVTAALQAHLLEEHKADLERAAAQSTFTNSLKLLRQARERLGEGLRAVEADHIAASDNISLRNEQHTRAIDV